ncbi:MAG: hypothetical protein ACHQ6T_00635 [Myxococcota bacterium]
MQFRFAALCAALCLSACAPGPVRLERYRAAYSTHFAGIPDQAEACAVVRNRGSHAVAWVELRVIGRSHFAGDSPLRSKWVYRGSIEPGQSVALRFLYPPVADQIEVSLARAGADGSGPQNGRPLALAAECSDGALRAALDVQLRGRTAPDIEVRAAERTTPDSTDDALLASP